jgi:hypothetical protein
VLRLLAPLLFVAACGGGRSGTGISDSVEALIATQPGVPETQAAATAAAQSVVTTIEGNVARLNLASRHRHGATNWLAAVASLVPKMTVAFADSGLGGIRVALDGWGSMVETAADGSFALRGGFSGPLILRFERDEEGLDATLPVDVPSGGRLSLHDVQLDTGREQAVTGPSDLTFDGVVVDTACLARRVVVASRFAPDGERFVVELARSTMVDESGKRVYCVELRAGDAAQVDGTILPTGAIGDGTLVVDGEGRLRQTMAMTPHLGEVAPLLGMPGVSSGH